VSAQQVKHTAYTLVHSMEGNLTAEQLLHSTGTEKEKEHSYMNRTHTKQNYSIQKL